MELKEFHYDLPRHLVADRPSPERPSARLLVVFKTSGEFVHARFSSLGDFLNPGDLIVLNNTKVFPARLKGKKESGGKIEMLLLESFSKQENDWIALIEASKKPPLGSRIFLTDGVYGEIVGELGRGRFGVRFHCQGDFNQQMMHLGEPPLPPYIQRQRRVMPADWERYQTVYATSPGAIAAPTAGLHFTADLLDSLGSKGIVKTFLTLHVGPGTFQPVREERIENHRMEGERYSLKGEAADKIREAKRRGGRVVAVGSTSTRVLEWIAQRKGRIEEDEGIARLFIRPGDPFRVIDGLITNFHLPGSTPLMLVAAFAGLDLVRRAYQEAVRLEYRFYSYGDAMLIL